MKLVKIAAMATFLLVSSLPMMAAKGSNRPSTATCAAWQDSFPGPNLDSTRWTVANGQAPGYIANNHIGYYEPGNALIVAPGVLRLTLTQGNGTVDTNTNGVISYGAMVRTNQVCGYGTYTWTMKMSSTGLCATSGACIGTAESGGVSAGFLYVNNSQTEIDFEFQGQNPNNVYLVNWLNTKTNSDPTGSMETSTMSNPFNPVDGQHTYTFIWSKGRIRYYIDQNWQGDHTTNVPTAPAYFMINHWGTNSTNWGGMATIGITRYFYITNVSYTP